MKSIDDVRKRANVAFNRNWRDWAAARFSAKAFAPALSVNLQPPREKDLASAKEIARARGWVSAWRACPLPGVEWQQRSWPSVGDQAIPLRVRLEGAEDIARWAGLADLWSLALARIDDVREHAESRWIDASCRMIAREAPLRSGGRNDAEVISLIGCAGEDEETLLAGNDYSDAEAASRAEYANEDGNAQEKRSRQDIISSLADVVRSDIDAWCSFPDNVWETALRVWNWLFEHDPGALYVRQLPIRGIDTKWIERHGKALKGVYRAIMGNGFSFREPSKPFRCKACCSEVTFAGCTEFALPASQLARMQAPPKRVIICENLVNALCLDDLPDTLAIHGSGFAVAELCAVPWLADVELVYWGDLDSNGFAILNMLRDFAPHARSVMMDARTLNRYFDLCVEEPKPATGMFGNLTADEREALELLRFGDPARGITNLRLEQERVEWDWAFAQIRSAVER